MEGMLPYTDKAPIEVDIIEARDLPARDRNGKSDPFVIIEGAHGVVKSAKTPVIKRTLNPAWKFHTVVEVYSHFVKLKFKVYDWDARGKHDSLGSCAIPKSTIIDGLPHDVWLPLKQKPRKTSSFLGTRPGGLKGELHVRVYLKRSGPVPCNYGEWYAFRRAVADEPFRMLHTKVEDAGSVPAFTEKISLGLAWKNGDFDSAIIAFDDKNQPVETIDHRNKTGCGGAVELSKRDIMPRKDEDNEVYNLDLGKVPPNIFRLACTVTSLLRKPLSSADSVSARVLLGSEVLGTVSMPKIGDSSALFFFFLQRNGAGAWFFRSNVDRISGNSASTATPDVSRILSGIPLF